MKAPKNSHGGLLFVRVCLIYIVSYPPKESYYSKKRTTVKQVYDNTNWGKINAGIRQSRCMTGGKIIENYVAGLRSNYAGVFLRLNVE